MSYGNNFSISSNHAVLKDLPHLQMFGHTAILDSSASWLGQHCNDGIELCFIIKGRFEWTIESNNFVLYPGDCTFTLPWQRHGGSNGVMNIGELAWIIIRPEKFSPQDELKLGKWSNIPSEQQRWIGKALRNSAVPYFAGDIFIKQLYQQFETAIFSDKAWRVNRVNRLLDELLCYTADKAETSQLIRKCAFNINQIHKKITADIIRPWSIADMEKLTGYGKSMLNQLMRTHTGYSTIGYIISLRVEKAQALLTNTTKPLSQVALECGFNNSQQFSSTFRKYSGKTPSAYRKSG
jgi:AraC-like DNA-binding protein